MGLIYFGGGSRQGAKAAPEMALYTSLFMARRHFGMRMAQLAEDLVISSSAFCPQTQK